VHAIARYKMIDFLRRRSGREALHEPLEDDDELLAASDEEAREAKRDLAKLLERLPDRQRLPIVHVKIEGRSVAETAKATGMSESAVKIGIHRGLRALAAFIREG
jgi:RNA polymerase sigma-70 factor (ECF subfamily)